MRSVLKIWTKLNKKDKMDKKGIEYIKRYLESIETVKIGGLGKI